jgi:hypothetical protein
MNLNDHPAVKAHKEYTDVAYSGEAPPKQEDFWLPNHDQLAPYLFQLPFVGKYVVMDTEQIDFPEQHWEAMQPEEIGLQINWQDDHGNYGGCRMIKMRNGKLGLNIWVNGCPLQSAPNYYVVEEGWDV